MTWLALIVFATDRGSGPGSPTDQWSLTGAGALQSLAIAGGGPVVASWLFLSQFADLLGSRRLRWVARGMTGLGAVLLAAPLLAPENVRANLAAAIGASCLVPALIVSVMLWREKPSSSLAAYAAGLVGLIAALALLPRTPLVTDSATLPSAFLAAVALTTLAWSLSLLFADLDRRRRQVAAHELALDAARKYRHVYYSVPIALLSVDQSGAVLRRNELAERLFGQALAQGRLNPLSKLIGKGETVRLLAAIRAGGSHRVELTLKVSGETRVFALDAILARSAIEISLSDISERSRLARTLEHIAYHDYLADCLNRRGLEREIDRLLPTFRNGPPTSFVYADLDRFKAINDVFGHAAGDAIVVEVARRLNAMPSDGHLVGRVGGDEFVVVLPGVPLKEAAARAEQMLQALVRETIEFEGMQLSVEASMGVIEAGPGMETRELIAYADEACAHSKRAGRGRVTALSPTDEVLVNYRAEKRYGKQLKFRLPAERMRVYAQPIVPLLDPTEPMSFEVLLRMEDERGRTESPARLIAAAERQGAMPAIDRFMLERTIQHLADYSVHRDRLGFIAINLSGTSLNDARFIDEAVAILRNDPASAGKICLEITESVALFDVAATRRFVDEMRSIGVMVALDDFGAGYTSFAYLKELPANLLKIDGQFITGIGRGTRDQNIVRAIQQVGRELGMKCLAEWVEDELTLNALIGLNVDYGQGFALGEPKPIDAWLVEPGRRPVAALPASQPS